MVLYTVAVILYTKLQCPHYSDKSHILRESQRYYIIPVGSLDYKIFNPKFRDWENQFRIAIRICNHVCVCVYLSKCTFALTAIFPGKYGLTGTTDIQNSQNQQL